MIAAQQQSFVENNFDIESKYYLCFNKCSMFHNMYHNTLVFRMNFKKLTGGCFKMPFTVCRSMKVMVHDNVNQAYSLKSSSH